MRLLSKLVCIAALTCGVVAPPLLQAQDEEEEQEDKEAAALKAKIAKTYKKGMRVDAKQPVLDRWLHAEVTVLEDASVCVTFPGWPKSLDECFDLDNVAARGTHAKGASTPPSKADLEQLGESEKAAARTFKPSSSGGGSPKDSTQAICSVKSQKQCAADARCSWSGGCKAK